MTEKLMLRHEVEEELVRIMTNVEGGYSSEEIRWNTKKTRIHIRCINC